jgi:hypothetical protein
MDNRKIILGLLLKGKVLTISDMDFKYDQLTNGILNITRNEIIGPSKFCSKYGWFDFEIHN